MKKLKTKAECRAARKAKRLKLGNEIQRGLDEMMQELGICEQEKPATDGMEQERT